MDSLPRRGEPLPNDDLDLQLAWLRAVDELGPQNINSKTLGEYWISYVQSQLERIRRGQGPTCAMDFCRRWPAK